MNKNITNEEILENVSGGRPVGRDGKPMNPNDFKNRKNEIHVTSGTFGPDDDHIHVTSATFTFGPDGTKYSSTDNDGIHVTSATF